MKTQSRKTRNIVVLTMALLFGPVVNAQIVPENGIHVNGGSSSALKVSSNIGNTTVATGYNSFASGYASEASGHTSTALGREAKAMGAYSGAFGNFVKASANNSFVLGTGVSSALPLANSSAGIIMGVNSQYPTFTISAAITGNLTGKVGIGNVTAPQAKLHIKGDAMENADILLASTGTNKSIIQFRSADNNITVGSDNVMKFNAASMQLNPSGQVVVNGAFKATGNIVMSGLASATPKALTVGANGQIASVEFSEFGDHLGNHKATQNINLNGKKIVNGTSGTGGIFVSTGGNVRIGTGTTMPTNALEVNGTTVSTSLKISGLASNTPKVLTVGVGGEVSATDLSVMGDNLGDHKATQNLNLNGKKIVNGTSGTGGIFVSTGGNVRIGTGTTMPTNALEVNGTTVSTSLKISGLASNIPKVLTVGVGGEVSATDLSVMGDNLGDHKARQNINLNGNKIVGTGGVSGIYVAGNGNVGVNTDQPQASLAVNGDVLAKEMRVSIASNDWPDYVFSSDYNMMSLAELEKYINEHRHLPGVPSASEVERQGNIDLGAMNTILLQKIEEMTLRMIEMEKKIERIEKSKLTNQ